MRGNNNNNNQGKKEVQDWEKQWDEDEDDDSDEEDIAAGRQGAAPPLHAIRPGMDTGHGDLSATSLITPTADALDVKPSFVTPDAVYDAPSSPKNQQRSFIESAPSSPNVVPVSDDDAVEWDTGHQAEDAKPNVTMFLPMLRVLGKGSFGKVRYNWRMCDEPITVCVSHSYIWSMLAGCPCSEATG